jgi:hypothetical protein
LARVAQNYGGEEAIGAAVARHPDLIFSGTMTHEQAQPGDGYWGFTGIKGKAEWAAFTLPEEDCLTVPQIERWVSRIEDKIARLTEDREFWTGQLEKPTVARAEPAEPDRDLEKDSSPIRTGPEVHAIMDKLRSERAAKRG